MYFPKGSDEIPENKLKSVWEERYLKYPELKKIGVIDDFHFLKKFLKELKIPKENFMKADSHKYIKSIIEKLPEKSQFR